MRQCRLIKRSAYCIGKAPEDATTYSELVDHYLREFQPKRRTDQLYFKTSKSLHEAIIRAASCKTPDMNRLLRHPHQRRITGEAIEGFTAALTRRLPSIRQAKTFKDLFAIVDSEGQRVFGIGDLTAYDVAERIGHYLGLAPERVYLHSGAAKGGMLLGLKGRSVDFDSLPVEITNRLSAAQCEDFLCIYKAQIARIGRPR